MSEMMPGTISATDCGNCKHFRKMSEEEHREHFLAPRESLYFGWCDKIPAGTVYDGKYTYDGYSFNDENYNESLRCFEPKEANQ